MKKPFLLLVLAASGAAPLAAQDRPENTRLRLPWPELERVLKINDTSVRLPYADFQKLLARTGTARPPVHTLEGGDVLLAREEFTRLLQSLLPPPSGAGEILLTHGATRVALRGDTLAGRTTLRVHLSPTGDGAPRRVDVFPAGPAFTDVRLDGRNVPAESDGRLWISIDKPGDHEVAVDFTLRFPQARAQQKLHLPLPKTAVTELDITLPERNLDIHVSQALATTLSALPGGTGAHCLLSPGQGTEIAWTLTRPDEAKGPARIYAETRHLLSVEEDALRARSDINLTLLQNSVSLLTAAIPAGFSVLEVSGEGVGDWREKAGRPALLEIPFLSPRSGSHTLTVTCEKVLTESTATVRWTGLPITGAQRDRGYLGVELRTADEVLPASAEGLDRVDARELPAELSSLSERPLLLAYQFRRPDFHLDIALRRHADVRLVTTVADAARADTLLLPDGRRVHRVTYFLRNAGKAFLELPLPPGTELWTAFVDDAPVKPSRGEGNKILIPLTFLRRGPARGVFPVEVVLEDRGKPFTLFKRETLSFPTPDVVVGRVDWTLHTPLDEKLLFGGGDFKRAQPPVVVQSGLIQTLGPADLSLKNKEDLKDARARRTVAASAPAVGDAVMEMETVASRKESLRADMPEETDAIAERPESSDPAPGFFRPKVGLEKGAGLGGAAQTKGEAGVLPIRVQVPWSGNPSSYSKTLPAKEEILHLTLWRFSTGMWTTLKIALLLALAGALVYCRRPLIGRAKKILIPLKPRLVALLPRLKKPGTHVAGAGLVTWLFSLFHPFLGALGFLAFLAAAARWFKPLIFPPKGDTHESR
jgi:hypothetical protein